MGSPSSPMWRWTALSSSSMTKPDNRLFFFLFPSVSMFSKTHLLINSRLSFVLFFFYLSISLLNFPPIFHQANAEVGLPFGSEHDAFPMDMRGKVWRMMDGACSLGPANNLVVDPVFRPRGNDFMKPQELYFSYTGPRLCQWLDQLYEAHEALRYEWEAA
ncbi:dense granule protein gra12, partial [Cystoisospora suis]